MTVYQMIQELTKFDPDAEINAEVSGYFKGTDDDNGDEITVLVLGQKAPINNYFREEDRYNIILDIGESL